MNEEIVRLREELVALSTDPMKTRSLLDKLAVEENDEHDLGAKFLVREDDIVETLDKEVYVVYKTKSGYVLHYRGGYTINIDQRMRNAYDTVGILFEKGTDEGTEMAKLAVETVFRLPIFIFSSPESTYTIAEIGVRYMELVQKLGEIPTEETENPEYDKFLVGINELMENLAAGLKKEGLEYEKRMGISHGESESKGEGQNEGEGKAEA